MGINNKIKNKISFVILHYLAFQDTIECIDSIISNYDRLCYEIVVVDNYSNNGSQEKLEIYYSGQNNIYFLKMGYNSGFAKGNNYGYQYAKKYLKPNYIILLNNDTILNQKDFLIKIDEIYQSAKFDILGPDIVSLSNNLHQNPMALFGINKENLGETIKTTRKLIIQNNIGYLSLRSKAGKLIRGIIKIQSSFQSNKLSEKIQENPLLHGSCLIFSSNYIEKYNGLFSGTFMFVEEEILWYIAQKENLKMLYSPEIKILHKEDASTNLLYGIGRRKRKFILKNSLKSLLLLREIRKNNLIYLNDVLAD